MRGLTTKIALQVIHRSLCGNGIVSPSSQYNVTQAAQNPPNRACFVAVICMPQSFSCLSANSANIALLCKHSFVLFWRKPVLTFQVICALLFLYEWFPAFIALTCFVSQSLLNLFFRMRGSRSFCPLCLCRPHLWRGIVSNLMRKITTCFTLRRYSGSLGCVLIKSHSRFYLSALSAAFLSLNTQRRKIFTLSQYTSVTSTMPPTWPSTIKRKIVNAFRDATVSALFYSKSSQGVNLRNRFANWLGSFGVQSSFEPFSILT